MPTERRVPPLVGRPGRPGRRPDSLLGDKGYDSNPTHRELRKRGIHARLLPQGAPNIHGPGKPRYVIEQTSALLHKLKRLAL